MTKKTKKTAEKAPVEINEEDLDKAAGGATFTERTINFTSTAPTQDFSVTEQDIHFTKES